MNNPRLLLSLLLRFFASLGALLLCVVAGFIIPLTLAWSSVTAEQNRKEAIELVTVLGARLLIFGLGGVAVWEIVTNRIVIGLLIALGSWPTAIIYLIFSDVLVGLILFLQGK